MQTACLPRSTREELRALVRAAEEVEGDTYDVASWLGCSKRSVDRWLAGGAGMAPSARRLLRLLAWLSHEGVDLVGLVQRDRAALWDDSPAVPEAGNDPGELPPA